MKTLNLEASKALAKLGVEVESEVWWQSFYTGDIKLLNYKEEKESNKYNCYPAPSFQELIEALPKIGEKLRWYDSPYFEVGSNTKIEWTPDWYTNAQLLLDTLMEKGMEGVSEEVLRLLKK
jgi:hypothetical protein